MKKHYTYMTALGGYGLEIFSPSGKSIAFLQGDEADDLRTQIESLDDHEYPIGPFETYNDHLDVLLDAYDL